MSFTSKTTVFAASALALFSASVFADFSVSNGKLLDANGNPFVMRGINYAHTWFTDKTASIADIANTGANTVRVVLSNGTQWTRNNGVEISTIIQTCKENQVICILEVHDSTGYPESSSASHISNATAYWLSDDIKMAIQGQEDYVIINIANEPFGNGVTEDTYVNDHKDAINALRTGGLSHTLMVDAGNWGQDWQFYMRDNATEIFNSDPDKNVVFDVHMYEVFNSASNVENYIKAFTDNNMVLVVGEFGATHNGNEVDEDAIMQYAAQYDIGYLGWSWSGNGPCCTDLDVVNNWAPNNLTSWGNRLINGSNGIQATSTVASIFVTSPAPTCTWHDNTVWPICEIDVGDWGWENNQSCISRSICPSASDNPGTCQ